MLHYLHKGPFRTKNIAALESVLFCYRRSLLLSVPLSAPFPQKNKYF